MRGVDDFKMRTLKTKKLWMWKSRQNQRNIEKMICFWFKEYFYIDKNDVLRSPILWLTFIILSVIFRLQSFNQDPFLPLRSWFICIYLITTRLHLLVTTHSHYFGYDSFTFFWTRLIYTFSFIIHSQPFDHDYFLPLVTFRLHFIGHDPFVTFWSQPFTHFFVMTHLHHFGHIHDTFTSIWSRFICILSAATCS